MRFAAFVSLIALSACSAGHDANNVDVNAAANAAQEDIDNYAAANAQMSSGESGTAPATSGDTPTAVPTGNEPGAPPETVPEQPFTPGSGQGAGDVVQRYYALIGEGKYRQAYALWDRGGQASGMSAAAFAASFAKYASYHAEVGAPKNPDAGAGQRYIQVPVRITGMLKSGGNFVLAGPLTLHKAADGIPSDDPSVHQWHISQSAIKPAGGQAASTQPDGGLPAVVSATYRCRGGPGFAVRFDNISDVARIQMGGKTIATLDGQRPASGIWYKGGGYELRGKGRNATFTRPDGATLNCIAAG